MRPDGRRVDATSFAVLAGDERESSKFGGLCFPQTADGPYQFAPPILAARKAVALGDASGPGVSDPATVVTKRQVNWGHAPAHQLERVLVDVDGDTGGFLERVDEVL